MNTVARSCLGFLFACFALVLVCAADEDPDRKPRLWGIKDEGDITATFEKFEGREGIIRTQDGKTRPVPLWRFNAKDLAYLQRQRCVIPAEIRRPEPAAGQHLLVDLAAANLPPGPLRKWENRGVLGGAFFPLNTPPVVEEVAGRKAVTFRYGPWALPMEFQPMVADFLVPQGLAEGGAFSVAAWLYQPRLVPDRATFLSWHPLTGDDGTEIGYGAEGRYPHEKLANGGAYFGPMGGVGFTGKFPESGQWRHIACTFTGGQDGEFRIYVDGQLSVARTFGRILRNLPATEVTQTTATVSADLFLRDNQPVTAWAYVGERDNHFWRWMRWKDMLDLGKRKSGRVSVAVKDLKPGTKYYFRFLLIADNEQRWSDGAGSFVTAGAAGEAPVTDLKKADSLMFLGCAWGSQWDWAAKPLRFYEGSLAGLKVYDKALSQREVKNLFGEFCAYGETPADGAALDTRRTVFSWQPGADGVKAYRVYFGTDRQAVENGDASALKGEQAQTTSDTGDLALGQTYFWRVDQVDESGQARWPGKVWSFKAETGKATGPMPADGAGAAGIYTAELKWTPGKHAQRQRVHFGTDRQAVLAGKSSVRDFGPKDNVCRIPLDRLEYGRTCYWRVEQVNGGGLPAVAGDVWSFTVEDYFDLEDDGPAVEPWPRVLKQNGYYGKYLEGDGHPVISTPDCPDKAMLIARKSCLKLMEKRPDIMRMMAANNCAIHLSHGPVPWGWSRFCCAAYGASVNMLSDPTFYWGQNMLIHELGHQVHMNGAEPLEPDFRQRLYRVYLANMEDLNWIGDYGSNNMWEYMAVLASAWANAGNADAEVYPRDRLRKNDPRAYFLLNDYWSGDLRVDLHPARGLKVAADGSVAEWSNSGGVEFWGKFGWERYAATAGAFKPVGRPMFQTVKGVAAVAFGGKDALVWDCRTRPQMAGNHEWSVELWACKAQGGDDEQTLLSWGPRGRGGAHFLWGGGNRCYFHGDKAAGQWQSRPAPGAWHHIVHVFKGGGLAGGPGEYRVYADGRLDSSAKHKLEIEPGRAVVIGGALEGETCRNGFTGALAHVRVYDYDLSDQQVEKHYAEERAGYVREDLAVGGALLVDLDARAFAPCPVGDSRPLYPPGTGRQWLRSWDNRGLLAGRLHNDRHMPEGSDPLVRQVDGITAVAFNRNDRMVSSFLPGTDAPEQSPGTIEAWVYRSPGATGGTFIQWGDFVLAGDCVTPGAWRHVAVARDGQRTKVYVDGTLRPGPGPALRIGALDRLHVGASWDGSRWQAWLDGAVAQVRVHRGTLSPQEINRNCETSDLNRAANPFPADGGRVVASRREPLGWTGGLAGRSQDYDVYLGTSRDEVAKAGRADKVYLGRQQPGKHVPALQPGTTCFWRVDGLNAAGEPQAKGPVWTFTTAAEVLIDLDARGLVAGKLAQWPNAGRLGGKFASAADVAAPIAATVDGRPAVSFDGKAHLMKSDFTLPAELAFDRPLAVELWVNNPEVAQRETVFSMAPFVALASYPDFSCNRALAFGYGSGGEDSPAAFDTGRGERQIGWKGGPPAAGRWHHIAYVYTGGLQGRMRVYVDGRLNVEEAYYTLCTAPGYPLHLGASWNTAAGPIHMFSGSLGGLRVYDYARTGEEIRKAAGTEMTLQ